MSINQKDIRAEGEIICKITYEFKVMLKIRQIDFELLVLESVTGPFYESVIG